MPLSTYAHIAQAVVNNKIGRVELPNMCTFIVTWRCNLRCFMCDVWKKTDHDDMSVDEIRHVFKQIPHLDSLRITGGEPFLRRDLTDITRAILEETNPTVLHVTTAGVMTERTLEYAKAVGSPRLHLKLSIDAVGARHDEIRGYRGLYDKSLRTLRGLVELREKYGFYVRLLQGEGARLRWDSRVRLRSALRRIRGFRAGAQIQRVALRKLMRPTLLDLARYPLAPGFSKADMQPPNFTPQDLLAHARALLGEAGRELGLAAAAVIQGLGMEGERFEVVLAGGAFQVKAVLRESVKAAVAAAAPGATVIDPRHEPAMGAALLALEAVSGS